jgi:enolase
MPRITSLTARQILDSRGNPTIEAEVGLEGGATGRASVPSGASTGIHEALELRDANPLHYGGKGVLKAVTHVKEIAQHFLNNEATDQMACDNELVLRDGTENLSKLGANAALSVSLAISKAAAESKNQPYFTYIHSLYSHVLEQYAPELPVPEMNMPVPFFNVLNGGAHTGWQSTNFQEFMVVPHAARTFKSALEQGSEIYHALKSILKEKGLSTLVGDEGGFAPMLKHDEQAVEFLIAAIEKAGFKPGKQVSIALDPATSELYENGEYTFKTTGKKHSTNDMVELWKKWTNDYPIMSLEDGLAQDDWAGWVKLNREVGNCVYLVGDDLLVTNTSRIERAIAEQACTALLMKLNQIGTLSEALIAVALSKSAGWRVVVSHRSGETEDTAIADIAVGIGAEYVKMGAPARSERTAKYNQLLRIEEQLSRT